MTNKTDEAIASSDKKKYRGRASENKRIGKNEGLNLEHTEDRFVSNATIQIEILFDWLEENIPPTKWAFEQFAEFVEDYKPFFTPELKAKVLNTADLLASSFNAKNKQVLTMLLKCRACLLLNVFLPHARREKTAL